MDPVWKEVLSLDITKPDDEVAIQIINILPEQPQGEREEILAEKKFYIGEIGNDTDDPLHELKDQCRIEDILVISNMENEQIG